MALEIVLDTSESYVKFKQGGTTVTGDIFADPGNKVEFQSAFRFAIFIKGYAPISKNPKRNTPQSPRLTKKPLSPADDDELVFASKLKQGVQQVSFNLKATLTPGDLYWYGVAVVNHYNAIVVIDPQIIIR